MKAVVFHGIGDIRVDEVPDPTIQEPSDAIVRLTASAICGTDLHFVRGTMAGMRPGTILGHEGVGIVEEVGSQVRNLRPGDRVVIASTIGCGFCSYCRAGYYAQCDTTEPTGGTAFFGGPEAAGAYDGMQAELVRVPYANVGCVRLPDEVTDDQAIMISDIFPTAWFGARLAEVDDGDTVAIFGAGPVGIFAVISAFLQGAGRVLSVDRHADRLDMAREQGAEPVNFDEEDPIDAIRELTGGIGPDRVIDAVGVDAEHVHAGPGAERTETPEEEFAQEVRQTAPEHVSDPTRPFSLGDSPAPSMALRWAVRSVAKAGTIGIIGVYPPTVQAFPIGEAMNKNLAILAGNCNHRRYIPELVHLVAGGLVEPDQVLTRRDEMVSAIDAYKAFDAREPGWMKVELEPSAA
jgi:threonine dehydrogenase-like Zn-dependent dehydrogenase